VAPTIESYEPDKDIDISQDPTEIASHIVAAKAKKSSRGEAKLVAPSQATTADDSGDVEVI